MTTEFHPVAEIFPMMSERELADLVEDVREHGQREPIWLHADGRIIDGRNRSVACDRLDIEPDVRTFAGGDDDLVAFVLSLNLHRRHLSESQRAMVASRIANLEKGQRADTSIDASGITQADAATMLNVGHASVQRAKKVIDKGGPELAALVDSGDVAVSAAAAVAEAVKDRAAGLPPEEVKAIFLDAVDQKREAIKAAVDKADEVRRHNEWVRDFNATVDPSVIAHAEEVGRRLDAVTRIAEGCEYLMRSVNGIDPERAVAEAHETNRSRLYTVHAALAYLTRVADAMTLESVHS